jgi:hypothetical protein
MNEYIVHEGTEILGATVKQHEGNDHVPPVVLLPTPPTIVVP